MRARYPPPDRHTSRNLFGHDAATCDGGHLDDERRTAMTHTTDIDARDERSDDRDGAVPASSIGASGNS
jgi:hypothetical protein